jgi:phytanoyl-CoA hydroxylase
MSGEPSETLLADAAIERAIADYRRDGYARLGVLASPQQLSAMRTRAEEIMLGKVRYEGMFFQQDTTSGRYEDLSYGKGYEGPTLNYRKLEKLELDPIYRSWIQNPTFRRLTQLCIGEAISVYRALIFNKAAETGGSALPWHQDGGKFWGLDREPQLQVWTALDDAPEESGCVEVVPATHLRGLASPLGGVIQPQYLDEQLVQERALKLPAQAGEVLLIHNHLWHRSGRNSTGKHRRGLTICYMDAATRCLRTKRAPREFFRPWPSQPEPLGP